MKNRYLFRLSTNQTLNILPVMLALACFSLQAQDCGEPPVISDNLDDYTAGEYIGPQSATWSTWSGGAGTSEDAFVSDEQAFSPPNSLKIEGFNGPTDVVLRLGDQAEGSWDLRWKMYIEPGFGAYYNIQNNQDINPAQWNLDVYFNSDGTGTIDGIGGFNYTQGQWIDIVHRIDLDTDNAELFIEGQQIGAWVYGPGWNLGGIDFYPANNGQNLYYVDDVILRPSPPAPPCPEGAVICDGFEIYSLSEVSPQSALWAPWTSSPADDGMVQDDPAFVRTGCQSLVISDADPDDQLLRLGDRTEGNYLLEWYMYIPEGKLGYYNFQKFQDDPGSEFGMQVAFSADGTATLDAGAAGATFNWTADTWMHFQHFIDLDNNWIRMVADSVVVYEWAANWQAFEQDGARQLGAVDFFGDTGVLFYLDDVLFQQLPPLPGNLCGGAQDIHNQFGQGVGNTVSSGPYDNTNYASTNQDPGFGYECFGEPDGSGATPSLERTMWFTFTGDGNDYRITAAPCGDDPIGEGDTQIAVYSGSCDGLAAVACNEDQAGASDLRSTVEFTAKAGVTYYMLVDGFGPGSEQFGEYCLEVTQLNQALVTVTFQVDASGLVAEGAFEGAMYLAGSFSGFGNIIMSDDDGDNIWTTEVAIAPSATYTYLFKNGPNGWEYIDISAGENCTVGDFRDRQVEVGEEDIILDAVCYNYCVACDEVVRIDERALQSGIKAFPNPAGERLNVQVDLPEPADGVSIRLLNAFGQPVCESYYGVLQSANIEVDVTDIPAGLYMLQVMGGKAQYTQAVVIE